MPSLLDRIREEIRRSGAIPFARFMELALYDAEGGYYTQASSPVGRKGDFVTAGDVGPAFGACMARQIRQIDVRVGPLDPFDIVEVGAGRGWLARDVLDELQVLDSDFASRVRYTMIDRSPAMRAAARARTPEADCLAPDRLPSGLAGCVLAVELFDALPVHRLRRRDGRLMEVRVGLDAEGGLIEREEPAPADLSALAGRYGAAGEEGTEGEIAPEAPDMLASLAGILDRGVTVVVDYGDPAPRLYERRPAGSLLAYHGHTTNQDYLERVGRQDLTAHVNFSALTDRARELGLDVLGLTSQDRFLIGNGILETFESPDQQSWSDPRNVKRRMQALQLIHPEAMGRVFRVLMLSKGCEAPLDLDGLRDPFAGS